MPQTLDGRLKQRLRAVLEHGPMTEAELRKLAEEGRACTLILGARLERSERVLAELGSDPASSLAEIAAALRAVNEVRPDLDELNALLAQLSGRAREFRRSWVSARSG
jgi:sirohydrochlorin ferrochelatase